VDYLGVQHKTEQMVKLLLVAEAVGEETPVELPANLVAGLELVEMAAMVV
jgi:hypothetical protein